ncbi:MAG: THUMP domain-containing protein [Nitrososphaerales archaeon]
MKKHRVLVSFSESVDASSKNLLARQISTLLRFSGLKFSNKETKKNIILINAEDPVEVAEALSKVPGVDYTAVVETTSSNYEDVVESIVRAGMKLIYPGETFAITVDIEGSLPYLSRDIEFATCARIIGELGKKNVRVNKKKPLKVIYAKIEDEIACIFYYKYDGPGGMPVGSKGRALCVLLGDNNSAVASWMMARQGIFPHLLFFDIRPYINHSYVKRVIAIATLLREFLPIRKYYLIALKIGFIIESLKQICSSKILPFLLNRMVIRITCAYADKIGMSTIVVGESLDKGSLQTIRDSFEISSKYNKQILFPLIGLSKKEVLDHSKRIGTFKFAKEREEESKRLSNRLNRGAIMEAESKLEIDRLVEEALSKAILVDLKSGFDDLHNILDDYFSQEHK